MHAPYYFVICGMYGSTIFFPPHYLIKHDFPKKVTENKMSVLFFSIILPETFFIPRRIQRDIITNVHMSSCKVPVILDRF